MLAYLTYMAQRIIEMHRVLKKVGQLVIIDMEATEEALRHIEDQIETMRDPSHVRNRSQREFLTLYEKHGYTVTKQETTTIPVSLSAWMALTHTPEKARVKIESMMKSELQNGLPTGFRPYLYNGEIYFEQRWMYLIGTALRKQ